MGIWDKINTATSVVDLIEKLAEDDTTQPTQPTSPPSEPEPTESSSSQPVPTDTSPTLPDFPSGNIVVKDINYLQTRVKVFALAALEECKSKYEITIVESYRTPERQDTLYGQGRTEAGNVVTNAQRMESYHNYGLALDITPVNDEIVDIFENNGFEWGGRWKSLKDTPHFQISFGLKISDLKKLYSQNGMQSVWDYIGYEN